MQFISLVSPHALFLFECSLDTQASAEKALELHGRELEPERALSVYISNPERKKERTDADANDREVYVAGLSRFTSKKDLEGVFSRVRPRLLSGSWSPTDPNHVFSMDLSRIFVWQKTRMDNQKASRLLNSKMRYTFYIWCSCMLIHQSYLGGRAFCSLRKQL